MKGRIALVMDAHSGRAAWRCQRNSRWIHFWHTLRQPTADAMC